MARSGTPSWRTSPAEPTEKPISEPVAVVLIATFVVNVTIWTLGYDDGVSRSIVVWPGGNWRPVPP